MKMCLILVATISIQNEVADNFRVKLRHAEDKINAQISNTIANIYDSPLYENLAPRVGFDMPIEV